MTTQEPAASSLISCELLAPGAIELDHQGLLTCRLTNGMPAGLDIFSAEVRPRVAAATEENFKIQPFRTTQVHIEAGGGSGELPMALQVHRPGHYAVTLDIDLYMSNGKKIRLQTARPIGLRCTAKTGGLTIEVDGVANLQGVNLPPESTVRVGERGNLRVNGDRGPAPSPTSETPAVRIALKEREYDGIAPQLDLRAFFKNWSDDKRKTVGLTYIDPETGAKLEKGRVGGVCCIRVTTHQAGHLTLFGRGTSCEYFVYAPNRHAPEATDLTQRTQGKATQRLDSHWPGNLQPLPLPSAPDDDVIHFGDPGTEQVMAVVTTKPLWPADSPEFMEKLPPSMVISLLKHFERDRDAELGFAEINVEEAG
jgi:hypothetical protein